MESDDPRLQIGVLAGIGLLAAIGWFFAFAMEPVPDEGPPAEPARSALKVPEAPVDEAMAAIAETNRTHFIRCRITGDVAWPFETVDHSDEIFRSVVPTSRGTRLVRDGDGKPVGVLDWSGARRGEPGGCALLNTQSTRVSGEVRSENQPLPGVTVRVCDATAITDEHGRFHVDAFTGQRCMARVSQSGWTSAFVTVPVVPDTPPIVLKTRSDDTPRSRRVLMPSRTSSQRALANGGVSTEARAVLQNWAERDAAADQRRKTLAAEVNQVLSP